MNFVNKFKKLFNKLCKRKNKPDDNDKNERKEKDIHTTDKNEKTNNCSADDESENDEYNDNKIIKNTKINKENLHATNECKNKRENETDKHIIKNIQLDDEQSINQEKLQSRATYARKEQTIMKNDTTNNTDTEQACDGVTAEDVVQNEIFPPSKIKKQCSNANKANCNDTNNKSTISEQACDGVTAEDVVQNEIFPPTKNKTRKPCNRNKNSKNNDNCDIAYDMKDNDKYNDTKTSKCNRKANATKRSNTTKKSDNNLPTNANYTMIATDEVCDSSKS